MTRRFIIVIFLLMEKYEIMDVIDEGAYGIVWKAVNRETGGVGTYSGSELQSKSLRRVMRTNFRRRPSRDK